MSVWILHRIISRTPHTSVDSNTRKKTSHVNIIILAILISFYYAKTKQDLSNTTHIQIEFHSEPIVIKKHYLHVPTPSDNITVY